MFETPHNEGVAGCCELAVEALVEFERDLCMVVRPEVGAVLSAGDLVAVDEVEVGC